MRAPKSRGSGIGNHRAYAAWNNSRDQSLEGFGRRLTSACDTPTPDFLALSNPTASPTNAAIVERSFPDVKSAN